jgi:hypothetical protein
MNRTATTLSISEQEESLLIWQSYQNDRSSKLDQFNLQTIKEHTECCVVVPVFKKTSTLAFSIKHNLSILGSHWSLRIITTQLLYEWTRTLLPEIPDHCFRIATDPALITLTRNDTLRLEHFWAALSAENLLFIDHNTIICRPINDSYLEYDYIAPLWAADYINPWCRFGDGAISFRHKSKMLEICQTCNTRSTLIESEDTFFSIMLRLEGQKYRLPEDHIAAEFAVQSVYHSKPFALHRAWEFHHANVIKELLSWINYSG